MRTLFSCRDSRDAIVVLERFCHIVAKTEITAETESLPTSDNAKCHKSETQRH